MHAGLLFRQLFVNRAGGLFGVDVLVSGVVRIGFIRAEGRRLRMHTLWLPIAGVLTVGVSLGFPPFLYLRERALEQIATKAIALGA